MLRMVTKTYSDKVYVSKTIVNLLYRLHIGPVLSIRRNVTGNCESRNEHIYLIQKIGYARYKKLKDSGI